jgi:hypothetical protein
LQVSVKHNEPDEGREKVDTLAVVPEPTVCIIDEPVPDVVVFYIFKIKY